MDKITTFLKDSSEPFRVIGSEQIHVDTNMVYGIKFVGGYDAEYPLSTAKFLGVLNSNDSNANPQDRYGLVTNTNSKLLDLVNTKYYVSLKSDEEKFEKNKKFKFLFTDSGVDIFGKHTIEMVYKPDSFFNGLKISLVSLVILAIMEIIVQVCKRKF
jgi:hypothetical protein